jgi:hypothetical protein
VNSQRVLFARVAAREEELLHRLVGAQEQQRAHGRLAIAPGASRFLVVRLGIWRQLVVQHETDVGLVDSQPERIRGHHDAQFAGHEALLHRGTFGGSELAVIQARGFARRCEGIVHLVRGAHRGRVDDAAAFARVDQSHGTLELVGFARHVLDAQVQVRAEAAGVDDPGRRDAQLLADVAARCVGRRGREGQDARLAQRSQPRPDLQVRRPEVMAPLRDAMRLVDDDQAHRVLLKGRTEAGVGEALGRDHHDLRGAILHRRLRCAALVAVDGAIELHGVHADFPQRLALVLHQCDQRRHHERAPGQQHGRELVAQRLAGARGHDRQRVRAGQHAIDHRLLPGPQPRDAENVAQRTAQAALQAALRLPAPHRQGRRSRSASVSMSFASRSVNSAASVSRAGKPSPDSSASSSALAATTWSGRMSAPSRPSVPGVTAPRSPVPTASLSACASKVPVASLPESELSLGPSASASRPLGCAGAVSAPRMLL